MNVKKYKIAIFGKLPEGLDEKKVLSEIDNFEKNNYEIVVFDVSKKDLLIKHVFEDEDVEHFDAYLEQRMAEDKLQTTWIFGKEMREGLNYRWFGYPLEYYVNNLL